MSMREFLPPPPWEGPPIPRNLQGGFSKIEVPFNETPAWVQEAWNDFEPHHRPRVTVRTGALVDIGPPHHEAIVRRVAAHSARRGETGVSWVPGYETLMSSHPRYQQLYLGGKVELTPGNSIAVMDYMPGLAHIALYMHPDDFQSSRAIGPTLTARQRKILATTRSFTSTYRREMFGRFQVRQNELDELQQMGLLDRRGAITIMGRNVSGNDQPFSPFEER